MNNNGNRSSTSFVLLKSIITRELHWKATTQMVVQIRYHSKFY